MGFATALHTGGMYPDRLAAVLPLLDWVGLDINGPQAGYDAITRTPGSGARAWQSLQLLLASGVDYECRTTWHEGLFDTPGLLGLAEQLARAGVVHWAPQECRTPDGPPTWGLTPAQQTLLQAQFPGFVLRSGL